MSNVGIQRLSTAMQLSATSETKAAESKEQAEQHPAGVVRLERTGTKSALKVGGIAGAVAGSALVIGAAVAGIRGGRVNMLPLLLGGGLGLSGAGMILGSGKLGPREQIAVATKFETREEAQKFAAGLTGRVTRVERDVVDGTFAVIDTGPARSNSNYSGGVGHYYGDGHYHGHHYYGDGHHHDHGYYEPWYPDTGNYYPDPYYPRPDYGRGNGPGDSGGGYRPDPGYGSGNGPGDSGGSYTPPSYDPPSYDPPSYDPPSYDPPSYDPPSYDPPSYDPPSYDPPSYDPPSYDPPSYDPPSYDPPSWDSGNSSDNGNPSWDDF